MQLRTHLDNPFPVYIPSHDSCRLSMDSPAERHHFEDVADVAGNKYIKRGSSSMSVETGKRLWALFKDPDMSNNIFPFPTSLVINDTLRAYRPTSGTGSFNSVQIRYAVTEIFARERRRIRGGFHRLEITSSREKYERQRQLHSRDPSFRHPRAKFGRDRTRGGGDTPGRTNIQID